jgi:aspartyl-tRNA(Asn)/glutamyl-tRNA(Gln) amidotransferase subunit A
MANSELLRLTISELAPKIREREVSPVEVTEAALAQADQIQPALNSFITILHEQAMSQAREQEAALLRGEYRGRYTASPSASKTTSPPPVSAPRWVPKFWPIISLEKMPR